MPKKSQIGVVGLATMGANLARNFASRGIRTLVFNRTFEKTEAFLEAHKNDFLSGEKEITNFVQGLETPRKILLMVKAGEATDATISTLLPFLESGDILIDGGNAHFSDTARREEFLNTKNIHFVGMGVSGGEEGALRGPSLMPGGSAFSLDQTLPLFEQIAAADFAGGKCITRFEGGGAGHFVKMVHNGVEYAIMQSLAEATALLRAQGRDFSEISGIFEKWNTGKLQSFLVELSATICRKKDADSGDFLLEKVLDIAEQKGTGRWTTLSAAEFGTATPMISAAVDARVFSEQKNLRRHLSPQYSHSHSSPDFSLESLENALFSAFLMAHSEGFWLLDSAAKSEKWSFDFSEIARIWQGGCILRADLLGLLQKNFSAHPTTAVLEIPEIFFLLSSAIPDLQKVLENAVKSGTPTPALSSAFFHFSQVTTDRSSAFFLQGLRDAFGAHGFQRIDREGSFHENWE